MQSTSALLAVTGPMQLELVCLAVVVVIGAILLIRRIVLRRQYRVRKAGTGSYHDTDLANYGSGPAGFAGAASARFSDGTSLAPSFSSGSTGAPTPYHPPEPTGLAGLAMMDPPPPPTAAPAPTGTAPAGWLPDPTDPAVLRYWNGTSWTEHTAQRS